ncbi:hypothetical protein H5410_031244 [Solanum commersonii]|uniref:FCP1 homology domain-containing protein n=1 Tax=Solanum commersonii TaxID=4109 RepID=A0A9J5YHU4_SOLCO|nr:hypothetical protein H5410_031244 [Solanum commersonii]
MPLGNHHKELEIWDGIVEKIEKREYREHVKDLLCISKDLSRMVIVDNNPFSFLLQPLNGIPCIPFSAGQPHDIQKSNQQGGLKY